MVHGFESTGCLVSRVWGIWFRRYCDTSLLTALVVTGKHSLETHGLMIQYRLLVVGTEQCTDTATPKALKQWILY